MITAGRKLQKGGEELRRLPGLFFLNMQKEYRKKMIALASVTALVSSLLAGCAAPSTHLMDSETTLSTYSNKIDDDTGNPANAPDDEETDSTESTDSSDFTWNEEHIRTALNVYGATDWSQFKFTGSTKIGSSVKANVTSDVRQMEQVIREQISSHPEYARCGDFVELLLAIMQYELNGEKAVTGPPNKYNEDPYKNTIKEDPSFGWTDKEVGEEIYNNDGSASGKAKAIASIDAELRKMSYYLSEMPSIQVTSEEDTIELLMAMEFDTQYGKSQGDNAKEYDFPWFVSVRNKNSTPKKKVGELAKDYNTEGGYNADLDFASNVMQYYTITNGGGSGFSDLSELSQKYAIQATIQLDELTGHAVIGKVMMSQDGDHAVSLDMCYEPGSSKNQYSTYYEMEANYAGAQMNQGGIAYAEDEGMDSSLSCTGLGDAHALTIALDPDTGMITGYVDGQEVLQQSSLGTTKIGSAGMCVQIGGKMGGDTVSGTISNISVKCGDTVTTYDDLESQASPQTHSGVGVTSISGDTCTIGGTITAASYINWDMAMSYTGDSFDGTLALNGWN